MNADSKTVLYVEDNLINVLLVEAIFESRPNVRLLTATTGHAGLGLAREHRPTLLLLDLNLGDMGGEDYLRQLRADPAGADIRVVIVSAEVMDEERSRLQDLGVVDFIAKPFEVRSFQTVIDRYLGPSNKP